MSKQCAFTICTKSYLGLALTLKESFLRHNKNFDFFIVLVDADENEKFDVENCIVAFSIMKKYISKEKFIEMSFKYDVTEFSTSIKPFALLNFIENHFELAAYFDPDIAFYSEFKEILNINKSVFITPHILTMQDIYTGDEKEGNILKYGIYNCGFIAFRNTAISLEVLSWWKNRLINFSFADAELGIYTDQKWIDFLPVFVDRENLEIIKNFGCNVAPWNYFEREIYYEEDIPFVRNRIGKQILKTKLCFAHFSGFNYKNIQLGNIQHSYRQLKKYGDIDLLLVEYGKMLIKNNASNYFAQKYMFSYYSNGTLILKFHRRIYRVFKETYEQIQDYSPFDSESFFYKFLKRNKLISKSNIDIKSKQMVGNYSRKEKIVFAFFKTIFNLLGVDRFSVFLLALQKYSKFESQVRWMKKEL